MSYFIYLREGRGSLMHVNILSKKEKVSMLDVTTSFFSLNLNFKFNWYIIFITTFGYRLSLYFQANSLWKIFGFFYAWNNRNSSCVLHCWQIWKEFRLPWHNFVRVQIYYKNRFSINRRIETLKRKSSMAQWWQHRPLESGVGSSDPVLYIFHLIKLFIFLSFLFIYSISK